MPAPKHVNVYIKFIPPLSKVRFAFGRWAANITTFRDLFNTLEKRLPRACLQQFRTQGAWGSGGWAPLSPRYAEWKARTHPGAPIGVLSGEYMHMMTSGEGIEVKKTPKTMRVGFNTAAMAGKGDRGRMAIYGPIFHHGRDDGVQPARPVLTLSHGEVVYWGKALQTWAYAEARAAGVPVGTARGR